MLNTTNWTLSTEGDCLQMVPSSKSITLFLVVLAIICVVSTCGNLLTITVVFINPLKNLQTPFTFFLVNLSIADLLQGVICIPFVMYKLHEHDHGLRLSSKAVHALTCISLLSVFFSTMIISLDRYIAIIDPIKYRARLSWKRCVKISLVVWMLSIVSGLLTVFTEYQLTAFLTYNYFMFVAGIIVMLVVFFRIFMVLKNQKSIFKNKLSMHAKSNRTSSISSRYDMERRVTIVLIIVLSIFMVTYIPGLVLLNITQFCTQCSCHIRFNVYVIRYILLVSNSAFNPFVYTVRMKNFRNSIKALFNSKLKRQYSYLLESSAS